jgi:multidrug efflux pump
MWIPRQVKVRHQGKEVIALGVSMAKGGDIIALGKALKLPRPRSKAELPPGCTWCRCRTSPRRWPVGQRIRQGADRGGGDRAGGELHQRWAFTSAAGQHPLWRATTLDMRPGLVVGITIPLVLAVTFLAMHYWGIGLHKISLGSLIIALGLLVDDAIIAVEMMVRKMEEGYDKVRAATFAYEITAMPMLTGTLITAAGFLPIGMAKSVTGVNTPLPSLR